MRVDNDDFTLVFLGDGSGNFSLELTYIKNRTAPYDLGEGEYHLAFVSREIWLQRGRSTERWAS